MNIIITTHNRPNHLKNCLIRLCDQDLDISLYEVVVVDSYSDTKDENLEVIDNVRTNYGLSIIYFYNMDRLGGLTKSRNIAVSLCKYDVIIQADDDCLPYRTYVSSVFEAFKHYNADLLIGRMTPLYETTPSQELISKLSSKYEEGYYISDFTVIDLGENDCKIPPRLAFGSNCAYKKTFYLASGGLGPDGYAAEYFYWNGNGEHNYTAKAKNIYYIANMHADHFISSKRFLPSFFNSRSKVYGIGESFNLVRNGEKPLFSRILFYSISNHLLSLSKSCMKLNYTGAARIINYLVGLIKHQIYCYKYPILLDFCRQEHWLDYDYNNLIKFSYSNDQWKLLPDK